MEFEGLIPILVADDNEDNRFLVGEYCRNSPYEITFAENGQNAIHAYKPERFVLIVMDLHMPVLDGFSAMRMIREAEHRTGVRRTPILAWTASSSPTEWAQARASGCDILLFKPTSKASFLESLTQATAPSFISAD